MASLTRRHSKSCNGFPGRVEKSGPKDGRCTCKPTYYLVVSTSKGGRVKLGHDRREAENALHKVRGQIVTDEYRTLENISFRDWADRWKASLKRPKENTLRSYDSTLDYARAAFGDKLVRKITTADVDAFLGLMADRAASTQAKHLRILSSCFRVAVARGYAARNPIDSLTASERPQQTKRESGYFTNAELPKLFQHVRAWDRPLFLTALKTGMRQGELLALTWGDIELGEQSIRVSRIYVPGIGVTKPKSHAGDRTVDIVNGAVEQFGLMLKELGGSPPDDALVFPGIRGGYRHNSNITRRLYDAMEDAGIPREGPTGQKRTFHSFRHTYAKLAIENGAQLSWLQRQLGHSSLKVTADVYGHFETAARKVEVAKLEDAFSV